jgi:hypothetical protein
VVIEKALTGDATMARFVVAQISPRPRGRTIHLDMPEDDDCNVVTAFNLTLRALCEGEITPDEAVTVGRFLDTRRRVLQAWQLEEKLTSYGRTIPGDPVWATDDGEEDEDDEDDEDAFEPEGDAPALDPELVAAAERHAAPSDPIPPTCPAAVLQSTCISPVPVIKGETQPAAAPLQSACISPAPGTLRGFPSIPATGVDRALPASVAQRLRGAAFPRDDGIGGGLAGFRARLDKVTDSTA